MGLMTKLFGTRSQRELKKIPNENVKRIATEHIEEIKSSNRRDFRF